MYHTNINSFRGIVYSENYGDPYVSNITGERASLELYFPKMLKMQFTSKFLDIGRKNIVNISGNR